MKRILALFLAAVLLGTMTACDPGRYTYPPGSQGASKPTAQEPPVLMVEDGFGASAEALRGTYSWMYDKGDGLWAGVEADSPHPLDCREFLEPLETASDTLTLNFDAPPQDITVQCWRDLHFGDPEASGEVADTDGTTLDLKRGAYVYEVTANWTGENLAAAGTAHYSFYVIRQDHEHTLADTPQTVEDPVSGYCGNTVTTIHLDGREYAFMDSDSVSLTDILINLAYDPMKVCRCAPEFTVDTELGGPYGVNLTHGYVRCEQGQADLTADQAALIQKILGNQT